MNSPHIVVVLDKSGSMGTCLDDTIGGFNAFIDKQDPSAHVSLITFNNNVTIEYQRVWCSHVKKLDKDGYRPSGSTSLYDAIGQGIALAGDENVILVVITDGHENSSKKIKHEQLTAAIEEFDNCDKNRQIIYIGANQDAVLEAGNLKIPVTRAMSYSTKYTSNAFDSVATAVNRSVSNNNAVEFTELERNQSMCISDSHEFERSPPQLQRQESMMQ
tara:strand:+ start:105 stop:755 length:651 start_codon:yes stop_codon:yes gene_type:complete